MIPLSCAKKEKPAGPAAKKEGTGVQQAVNEVYLQETEEGKKRWELWADSVEFFPEKKILKKVRFEFYRDEDILYLKGDEAEIMNESGDITISGHVTGKSTRGIELAADRLLWKAKEEILFTESPVKLMSESIFIAGTGLETTPKIREAELKKDVYVTFFQDITDEVPMVIRSETLRAYFGESPKAVFDTDVSVKDSRVDIHCGNLTINFTPDGRRVEQGIARENVVIVTKDMEAECGEAYLFSKEKKIVLESDPVLWHEKVKCRGERIIYFEDEKKVLVENEIKGIFLPKTIDNIVNKR